MPAPSLVMLGNGGSGDVAAQVSYDIRVRMQALRPELDIHTAFLDPRRAGMPSVVQVANKLARTRVEEAVMVPLLISDAFVAESGVPEAIAQVRSAQSSLRVAVARPIGPEAALLNTVDHRLREALRRRHATELDGLVLAATGSNDVRSNALLARRARQWGSHHRLPCLTGFTNGSGPTPGDAIRTLWAQGRRHIAVGSWFLTDGLQFQSAKASASAAGAVAIGAPIGSTDQIAELGLARFVVAAMDMIDIDGESADVPKPAPARHLSVVAG